jgi:hypothetical protein
MSKNLYSLIAAGAPAPSHAFLRTPLGPIETVLAGPLEPYEGLCPC